MKSYKLKAYSTPIHSLIVNSALFFGVATFFLALVYQLPILPSAICLVAIIGVGKVVGIKFYQAIGAFSIHNGGFSIRWIKRFGILAHPDYDIRFEDIKDYVLEPWGDCCRLKISMVSGKTIKLEFRDDMKGIDSPVAFRDLEVAIRDFNNNDNDPANDIQFGKTAWQRTPAKILAFITVLAVVFGWVKVLGDGQAEAKILRLILLTLAAGFVVAKVISASMSRSSSK